MKIDTKLCVPLTAKAKGLAAGAVPCCYLRRNEAVLSSPAELYNRTLPTYSDSDDSSTENGEFEGTTCTTASGRVIVFQPFVAYTPVLSSARIAGRRRTLGPESVVELTRSLERLFTEDDRDRVSVDESKIKFPHGGTGKEINGEPSRKKRAPSTSALERMFVDDDHRGVDAEDGAINKKSRLGQKEMAPVKA